MSKEMIVAAKLQIPICEVYCNVTFFYRCTDHMHDYKGSILNCMHPMSEMLVYCHSERVIYDWKVKINTFVIEYLFYNLFKVYASLFNFNFELYLVDKME